ncbi:MAG: hypothetical protein IJC16_00145 [Rikenellaceae bacterium]|nr:hypothetical protein [Rikenellaceae bacterium]
MKQIFHTLQNWYYYRRLGRAIDKAEDMREKTGYRYLVIRIHNKIRIVPRKRLKEMISRRMFRKGITIEQLERRALYITR